MKRLDIELISGKTFTLIERWGDLPFLYRPITAITQAAPARFTAVAHGLPDGWDAAAVSVQGMTQINARTPPRSDEYHLITVISVDTVEMNDVNSAEFEAYTSGGYLQALSPVSLAGRQAQLTIRDTPGGASLVVLTSNPAAGIVLDNTAKTISVKITPAQAALIVGTGALDMEILEANGDVTAYAYGIVTVRTE